MPSACRVRMGSSTQGTVSPAAGLASVTVLARAPVSAIRAGVATATVIARSASPASAPIISNIVVSNVGATSFGVSWHVSEGAQGWVVYDTSSHSSYLDYPNSTTHETSYQYQDHGPQLLTGLTPGVTYHFRIVAVDFDQNTVQSSDQSQATTGSTGSYPAPSTLAYVAPTSVALPSVGVSTLDPTWGTHYIRVGAGTRSGHAYSTHSAWNSDGSWIWDHYASQLINASTWAVVGTRTAPSEPIWAYTDPVRMYGMSGSNVFGYRNMSTDTWVTLFTFSGYGTVKLGNFDGGMSWDDRFFLFRGQPTGGGLRMIVLDRKTGGTADNCSIAATLTITNDPDNYKMSASGASAVINWENNNGTGSNQGVWDYQFTGSQLIPRRQLQPDGDHGDCGKDVNGNDIYVSSYNGNLGNGLSNIYAYRLGQSSSSLDVGRLLPQSAGYQFQQGHVSMQQASLRPGYVYLSSFLGGTTNPGRNQVISVKTDGTGFTTGQVEVWGFHRTDSTDTGSQAAYENQPWASPNRDGTKVAIKSKWSTADATSPTFRLFVLTA